MNQRIKQDTESRINILRDKLQSGHINPEIVRHISTIIGQIDAGNFQGAANAHKEITQRHWNEAKDYANALKVLITFKQKFANH